MGPLFFLSAMLLLFKKVYVTKKSYLNIEKDII
jgi:hypothetical protein